MNKGIEQMDSENAKDKPLCPDVDVYYRIAQLENDIDEVRQGVEMVLELHKKLLNKLNEMFGGNIRSW